MARDKLEFTAWFEVNRTFGSGDIIFLILGGPIGPPPRRLRVKNIKIGLVTLYVARRDSLNKK